MKKITAILLVLLCISLCCCNSDSESEDSVSFYYQLPLLNNADQLHESVISSEDRDISGNRDNLRYLLTLYFRGPLDSDLSTPFPAGTSVVNMTTEDSSLILTLNSSFAQLEGLDLTIASVCLAMTCFELSDADSVWIEAVSADEETTVSMNITRDSYLLMDSIPETEPTE